MKSVFNQSIRTLVLLSVFFAATSWADVVIKLTEPNWQFLLESQPISPTTAQLDPNERPFAQIIQPLLNKQDFAAVALAFESRPLAADSAALLQLRGQVLLSLKRNAEAENALNAALVKMPNLALAHRSLSMLFMLNKNYEQARDHLTRSIELGVADAQLYGQLAFINLNNQRPAAAISGYQQALFLQPNNTQWQQGLLYAWLNSHNFDSAQRLVEDMIEQGEHAHPAELWLMRSQIALKRQQPEQALASLEIALQLEPNDSSNRLLAAKLHLQYGSMARSVELLQLSLDNKQQVPSQETWQTLGQMLPWLLNQERYDYAAILLKAAKGAEIPASTEAYLDLYRGQLALNKNELTLASGVLLDALRHDPLLAEALLTLAKVYQAQHKYQLAENYYVRASALPQVRQQALLAHAQLQIEQGQYQHALELLQQVLKIEPNRQDIQHNVRELQKLVRQDQYAT